MPGTLAVAQQFGGFDDAGCSRGLKEFWLSSCPYSLLQPYLDGQCASVPLWQSKDRDAFNDGLRLARQHPAPDQLVSRFCPGYTYGSAAPATPAWKTAKPG